MSKIEEYINYISSVRGFSINTIISYKTDLCDYEIYCKRLEIKPEDAEPTVIRNYIADMSFENKKPITINRSLSSIRGFYNYLIHFNYRKEHPMETLSNLKAPSALPSVLSETELTEFAKLSETEKCVMPLRDKAIILMLYSTGSRINELLSLKINSFDAKYESARIIGKGNKERFVFLSASAKKALLSYLEERNRVVKEKNIDALFVNYAGKALTSGGARWIIARYEKMSNLKKHIHPHTFRHTFATQLLNNGADIRIVQELLGHESISTTQRYTHISMARLKNVYKKTRGR